MPNQQQLKQSDYQALAEFRYQIRRYIRVSEEAAREAGIEPQHHQMMLAIKGKPDKEDPSIAYLAERLQLQHHSAVELVDRLEKKGLIERQRSEADRRQVWVRLTESGEHILAELTRQMRSEMQTAAPALAATLRKLTTRAKPSAASGDQRSRTAIAKRSSK